MVDTVIANEILNALDSSVLSSESKNSILADYLRQAHQEGYREGQASVLDLDQSNKATPVIVINKYRELMKKVDQHVG